MERLHKVSAGFIFAFICLHFANHLIGLQGQGAHQQFLEAARLVYRHPIVEMVLLMAFVIQIITGIALAREIWTRKKDFIHQLQAASGAYMAFFIIFHVAGVFMGRLMMNLDTNFEFAAVTLTKPWIYFFLPYYALAIMAIFTHIGCICYDIFKKTNKRLGGACVVVAMGVGVYVTYLILMMYSGQLYPVTIAEPYIEAFGGEPTYYLGPEEALPAVEGASQPEAEEAASQN
jgi:hypothetical protein